MAIYTLVRNLDARGVVPFLIKFCVKFKYILGAEFDTIPTPLATVFQDMDLATGYLDFS